MSEQEILQRLCGSGGTGVSSCEALMQTTLIRDELISAFSLDLPEQARFSAVRSAIGAIAGPDYSQRGKDVRDAAEQVLRTARSRLDDLKSKLSGTLQQLTEARTLASGAADVQAALETIAQAVPDAVGERRLTAARQWVANRRLLLRRFKEAQDLARTAAQLARAVSLDSFREALHDARAQLATAEVEAEAAAAVAALAEEGLATAIQADETAAHFAALIEHGTALGLQDGHCPLCAAGRTHPEFSEALKQTRERIAEQGARVAEAQLRVRAAHNEHIERTGSRDAAKFALEALQREVEQADRAFTLARSAYDTLGFQYLAIDDLELAEKALNEEQQEVFRIEVALNTIEASSAADRVSTLEERVRSLRQEIDAANATVFHHERVAEITRQVDTALKSVNNEFLVEQFDTVMPLVKELYRRLRPHSFWTEIDSDFGGRVRGSLNFTVGDGHNPQFLFSSGQRRAAGLAFLLAMHLSRSWCTWQTLLLDDPVQHVDDYRALNLVEVLAAVRRSGRQVIVAVEDSALADLLCRRLRSSNSQPGIRYELAPSADGSLNLAVHQAISPLPAAVLGLQRG